MLKTEAPERSSYCLQKQTENLVEKQEKRLLHAQPNESPRRQLKPQSIESDEIDYCSQNRKGRHGKDVNIDSGLDVTNERFFITDPSKS